MNPQQIDFLDGLIEGARTNPEAVGIYLDISESGSINFNLVTKSFSILDKPYSMDK